MEVFDVFENGDLQIVTDGEVLSDIIKTDGTSSKSCFVILNHDWKICYIWVGKEANTRKKFASARSSRTVINDRRLSYRIKTVDEDSEPDVFKEILKDSIRKFVRDEGPTLEVIEIQKRVKETPILEGYEREGVLIGKNYYVAVVTKIMGSEVLKFEKSAFLPEGVTELPENYVSRMYIKHGKVVALEFLSKRTGDLLKKPEEVEKISNKDESKPKSEKKTQEKPKTVKKAKVSVKQKPINE
ncbi:MAG: hypothetical protein EAX96_09015 [Candidatus Lokiarchaeota archaeon]|nr:hypothetical protein [Candidatus Lokiarchaeota archaeon]